MELGLESSGKNRPGRGGFPWVEFSGWEFSWVRNFQVGIFRVGIILGGDFPRGDFPCTSLNIQI